MANDIDIVIGAQDKATATINAVAGKVASFSGSFAALGPVAAGVGTALVGVTAAFASMSVAINAVSEAANRIDALTDVAAGLGESVGDLQAFQFAMSEAGNVDAGKSIASLQKVQKIVGEVASGGNQGAADIFTQLGINANELTLQGPIDQFTALKAGLASIENVSERAATAQKLLGKSAADLIPALISEQDEFQASMDAASALGVVVSEEGAAGIASMNDAIGRVSAGMEGLANNVAVAVAPAVEAIALVLAEWLPPTIAIAEQYLPAIVDTVVVATGYAYDLLKALGQVYALDLSGAASTLSEMDSGTKWLEGVQAARERAADTAAANAEKLKSIAAAAAVVDEDAIASEEKKADAVAKTIADLERKLAVEQQGEDAVKRREEIALATNDAEAKRISMLQWEIGAQETINEINKERNDAEKKAAEERAKSYSDTIASLEEQIAVAVKGSDAVTADKQLATASSDEERARIQALQNAANEIKKQDALSKVQPGVTATESRLLTRGPAEKGIDKIARSSEQSVKLLDDILQKIHPAESGSQSTIYEQVG